MIQADKSKEPSPKKVWITLAAVALCTLGLLAGVWVSGKASKDTLWYEVAKTSLQVLAVVVIGGIVTIATSELQHSRQIAAQQSEKDRQEADKELERRRQEFATRAALLERTSRCAQKMFVTCQHVRRVQSDRQSEGGQDLPAEARALLDEVYREFSAESKALEMELGARYGICEEISAVDVSGEVYRRWHQIDDLLTAYYFNLCGNFRKNVLQSNSIGYEGKFHSGIDLKSMVQYSMHPTKSELKDMRDEIRPHFYEAMRVLPEVILNGKIIASANKASG